MRLEDKLPEVHSDYLCSSCKSPLYVEIGKDPVEAVCPNLNCGLHPKDLTFLDLTKAETLKKEFGERAKTIYDRIAKTNRTIFINYIYGERLSITKEVLTTGKVGFRKWLAIDDLLVHLSKFPPTGQEKDLLKFDALLTDYIDLFESLCTIENVSNERYLISTDKKTYMIKYWKIILEFYESHGIVAGMDKAATQVLTYGEIDNAVKEKVDLTYETDWGKYFQQMFDFAINLGYMFDSQYVTSKQHNYNPTGLDITALLGLFFSTGQYIERWSMDGIIKHFVNNAIAAKASQESFENFYNKYISGQSLAPLIVYDGESCLFDRFTLFCYLLYLIKTNKRLSAGQTSLGSSNIAAKREEASLVFEDRVRARLRESGYFVPDKSIIAREESEEHEYDAIGVNEKEKKIVIIEAKYRDFSPSSISGRTLVKQELLGEDRLLEWVVDANDKLKFFLSHADKFKGLLKFQDSLSDYSITMWIVTKHTPLIYSYQMVNVIPFSRFYETFNSKNKKETRVS